LEVCQVGTDEIPVLTATDHKVGPFSEYLWNTKYLDGTELLISRYLIRLNIFVVLL